MRLSNICLVGLVTLMPSIAMASLLGVQLQGNGSALAPSTVAGVWSQDNFNVVTGLSGTNVALPTYADGSPSHITLTFSGDDIYNTNAGNSDGNHTLLSGKVGSGTGTATFTLNNVPSGYYGLAVYTVNDTTGHYPKVSVGSTSYYLESQPGGSFNGTFIPTSNTTPGVYPVANYVNFSGIVPVANSITVTVSNAQSYYADINGLQLVSVPEPASMGLLGVAAVSLLARRRK